jgi:hypothetical protein
VKSQREVQRQREVKSQREVQRQRKAKRQREVQGRQEAAAAPEQVKAMDVPSRELMEGSRMAQL